MTEQKEEDQQKELVGIGKDVEYIRRDIDEIKKEIKSLKDDYVTQTEFKPIQRIVYGMVALILVSVLAAILALVIKSGGL